MLRIRMRKNLCTASAYNTCVQYHLQRVVVDIGPVIVDIVVVVGGTANTTLCISALNMHNSEQQQQYQEDKKVQKENLAVGTLDFSTLQER